MSISCEHDYDYGLKGVGDPVLVVCRKERVASCCGKNIITNEHMYRQSMYDYDSYKTSSPLWLCEPCGDMSLNLIELGFHFSLSESITEQWANYINTEKT